MKLDINGIVAAIALCVSIFSPGVVAWINNRHADKAFKREFYEKRKCEVIENYLKCIGGIIFYNDYQNQALSAEYISEIYMYAPETMWKDIDEINSLALNIACRHGEDGYSKEAIKAKYIDFCKKFSKFNREQVAAPKSIMRSLLSQLLRKK